MSVPPAPDPLFLPKFDIWCHQRGLKLREIAKALGCSPEAVRRYRLPFTDVRRRTPRPEVVNRVILWTGGEVQAWDWYPSPEVVRLMAQRAAA